MSFFVSKDIEKIVDENSLNNNSFHENSFYLKASDNNNFNISSVSFKKNKKAIIFLDTEKNVSCLLNDNLNFSIIINKHQYKVSNLFIKSIKKNEKKLLIKIKAIIGE